MLKAFVKCRVEIHLEDLSLDPTAQARGVLKYDLTLARAGVVEVASKEKAEQMLGYFSASIDSEFQAYAIKDLKGEHKPGLELAKGGDQEPPKGSNGTTN